MEDFQELFRYSLIFYPLLLDTNIFKLGSTIGETLCVNKLVCERLDSPNCFSLLGTPKFKNYLSSSKFGDLVFQPFSSVATPVSTTLYAQIRFFNADAVKINHSFIHSFIHLISS